MKICKVCQTRYDDRVEFCFRDGTPLGPVVCEPENWSVDNEEAAEDSAATASTPAATPQQKDAPVKPSAPEPVVKPPTPSPRARPARRTSAFADLGLEAPEPSALLTDAPAPPLGAPQAPPPAVTPPVSDQQATPTPLNTPTPVEIEATGDLPGFTPEDDPFPADAEPNVGEEASEWDPFAGMTTDDLDGENAPVDFESALGEDVQFGEDGADTPSAPVGGPPTQPKGLFLTMGALALLCVWIGFKAMPGSETTSTDPAVVATNTTINTPIIEQAPPTPDPTEMPAEADNAEGEDADNAEGEDADNAEGEDADNAEGEDADDEDAEGEDADDEAEDAEDTEDEVGADQPPEPPPLPPTSSDDSSFAVMDNADDGAVDLWGAEESAVQKGKLHIESIPQNARVFIDGKVVGRTGYTTRLDFGQYTVRVELDGYKTESRVVIVGTEEGVHVPIELKRRERVARVTVTAPVGSKIIVDDDPKEHAAPAFISLTEGLHSFRVTTPDGSFILQREVEIDEKGRAKPIALDMPGG